MWTITYLYTQYFTFVKKINYLQLNITIYNTLYTIYKWLKLDVIRSLWGVEGAAGNAAVVVGLQGRHGWSQWREGHEVLEEGRRWWTYSRAWCQHRRCGHCCRLRNENDRLRCWGWWWWHIRRLVATSRRHRVRQLVCGHCWCDGP